MYQDKLWDYPRKIKPPDQRSPLEDYFKNAADWVKNAIKPLKPVNAPNKFMARFIVAYY
jgi:hypothetical protein